MDLAEDRQRAGRGEPGCSLEILALGSGMGALRSGPGCLTHGDTLATGLCGHSSDWLASMQCDLLLLYSGRRNTGCWQHFHSIGVKPGMAMEGEGKDGCLERRDGQSKLTPTSASL